MIHSPSKTVLGFMLVLALFGRAAGPTPGGTDPRNPAAGSTSVATAPAFPLPALSALGSSFAKNSRLAELGWSEEQIAAFLQGVGGYLRRKPYAMNDEASLVGAEIVRRLAEIESNKRQEAVVAFAQPDYLAKYLKEMRQRQGMQQSDSGMLYRITVGRASIRPRPGDTVVVSCLATAADGTTKLPQLSNERIRVKLENILPGFIEGFQMMSPESQALFVLPPNLTFGEGTWPEGVDRGTPLCFLITLHEVISAESAP